MHTSMYTYSHTYSHTCVYICTHISIHIYIYIYIYICVCVRICMRIYMYIYIYIYIHLLSYLFPCLFFIYLFTYAHMVGQRTLMTPNTSWEHQTNMSGSRGSVSGIGNTCEQLGSSPGGRRGAIILGLGFGWGFVGESQVASFLQLCCPTRGFPSV